MKVYLEVPGGMSRAMDRVANALALYAPKHVETTQVPSESDLVVVHVIGYPETEKFVGLIRKAGKRYAIMQYCMRTTQRPNTNDWRDIWAGAVCVWSYYDLPQLIREDGGAPVDFNFYHAPLGVDAWAFYPYDRPTVRNFTILTSGYVAETEGVREAEEAVRRVNGNHFHLGPDLGFSPLTRRALGISDDELAGVYRSCRFVAGLRRAEGFEMPAAEGLVCGARPVCFDRPHYRRWFEPWAVFIPEGTFEEVVVSLTGLFEHAREAGIPPVSFEESRAAAARFDWATLVPAFWSACGAEEDKQKEMTT